MSSSRAPKPAGRTGPEPSTVGQLLRETLRSQGAGQIDLARATGLSTKHINQILQDQIDLSPDCAVRIGRVLGIPGSVWLALQGLRKQWEADQIDPGPYKPIDSKLRRQRDQAIAEAKALRRDLEHLHSQLRKLAPDTPATSPSTPEQQP